MTWINTRGSLFYWLACIVPLLRPYLHIFGSQALRRCFRSKIAGTGAPCITADIVSDVITFKIFLLARGPSPPLAVYCCFLDQHDITTVNSHTTVITIRGPGPPVITHELDLKKFQHVVSVALKLVCLGTDSLCMHPSDNSADSTEEFKDVSASVK